jgi:putative inorganic carbon (hco3(-)) transporter
MPHFGLESAAPYILYYSGVLAFFLAIFWRPVFGLFYLVPLIPIQTVRYWMHPFPFGQSVQDLMLLSVALGILRKGEAVFPQTPITRFLGWMTLYTYISLWLGSILTGSELPLWIDSPRLVDWKNYMALPLLFWLTTAAVKKKWEMYVLVGMMLLATLALNRSFYDSIEGRDMSEFKEENRSEGAMGYAGVNGMAAYEASMATVLLALAFFESNYLLKFVYYGTASFSIYCIMFAFSRGGYLAILLGLLFLGITKKRIILVAFAVFLVSWQEIVPPSVVQRVSGTVTSDGNLESSANIRVNLWDEAMEVFRSNPITGMGMFTYAYRGGKFKNPHNYYVQALVEGGVIGLFFFVGTLWFLFKTGYTLFKRGTDPFYRSIGLALAGWIVCSAGCNFFGDRWTYFQVSGFLWTLAGMSCRAMFIEEEWAETDAAEAEEEWEEETQEVAAIQPA